MTCRMGVHDAHSVAGHLDRFLFPALCIRWQRTWSSAGHLAWPRRSVPARGEPPKPCDAPASLLAPAGPSQWRRIPTVGVGSKPVGAAVLGLMLPPWRMPPLPVPLQLWRRQRGRRGSGAGGLEQGRPTLSIGAHCPRRSMTPPSAAGPHSPWSGAPGETGALEPGLCRGALSHYLAVEAKYSRSPPIEP